MTVQGRVDETNWAFSDRSSFLVDLRCKLALIYFILNDKEHTKVKTEAKSGEAKLEP